MRVLLVQPPLDPTTSQLSTLGIPEPLGLEYVAATIPEHEVRILDLRVSGSLEAEISSFSPDIVGVSSMTANLPRSLELLRRAKSCDSGIFTVIGGHHPTLLPADCQVEDVDFIVRGDGEQCFGQLVRAIESRGSFESIPGICYRSGSEWHTNDPKSTLPLDKYPVPNRKLTEKNRSAYFRVSLGPIISALTSKGCSRRCHFCAIWRFYQGKYRKRRAESVVAELSEQPEMTIDFVDDDAFANLNHMENLRKVVSRELPGRTFRFYARADAIVRDPGLFERWANAGMKYVLIGLESFKNEELRDMNKSLTAAQNIQALSILKGIGIGVIGFLIVRPDFLVDDFKYLADTVEKLEILQPVYGTLTPFPGTTLFNNMKNKLITDNWEHFDGIHAVVETALPRNEYYHQLANLYRRSYSGYPKPTDGSVPWFEKLAEAIENIGD